MVAVANRRPERALDVFRYAGIDDIASVDDQASLEDAIRAGRPAVTDDALLLARSEQVDVLVDVTGSVEFGAHVVLEAFAHGTHIVLMNAEIDATIGPILHVKAREAGVIMSACEGDEPGLELNLVRWVRGLGLIPRVIGNVKGLQDRYRNPTTQEGFARQWGQNPYMVTSFADGSKISFEQTIVANATGFGVLQRGMSRGLEFNDDPQELPRLYDLDVLRERGGVIDYTVGPAGVKIFRPRRAPRSEAAALPEALQDGRRPPVHLHDPLSPRAFRGPERDRTRRPLRRRSGSAARRPGRRSLRLRKAGSPCRRSPRRVRRIHDLRRGGELRTRCGPDAISRRVWPRAAPSCATSPRTPS